MAGTSPTPDTTSKTRSKTSPPWNVLVHDDPVNLMDYVTLVLKRVFGYPQSKAEHLMKQVHFAGKALVWSGEKEKAEFYVQQLHSHQLQASMEKAE